MDDPIDMGPDPYEQRRNDALLFRLGGAPAASAAAWLSAIDRAERDGRPCPDWGELERIAPSLPVVATATGETVIVEVEGWLEVRDSVHATFLVPGEQLEVRRGDGSLIGLLIYARPEEVEQAQERLDAAKEAGLVD